MNYSSFYKITYGLFIISSKKDNILNGYIANTAFQVTSDPPQVAVCCSKNNYTSHIINKSRLFSISVLEQDTDQNTIRVFGYQSGKNKNKFENIEYITGKTGVPIVTQNTIAWFECKVNNIVDVGSHLIYIADIVENDLIDEDREPLTYEYYRKTRKGAAPKNAPTYIDRSKFNLNQNVMKKYECKICGHIYDEAVGDPNSGVAAGTKFEDLPDDWVCPVCGAEKSDFEEVK